jgi:hypothetical protein
MNPIKTYVHDGGRVGDGFGHEKSDCVIRAYAIAKQIPYAEAHQIFEKAGRKNNHGTSLNTVSSVFGVNEQRVGELWKGLTLKKFLMWHNVGTYLVFNRNHAFCIKDGVVFDERCHTGKTKVYGYWKVEVLA